MRTYLKPGDCAVDLICGAGSITLFLGEPGARINGIDLTPGLITLTQEEATQCGAQLFRCLPQAVMCWQVGEGNGVK